MHSPVGQDTAFPLPAIVIFSLQVSPDIIREPLERGLHGLICMNNPQKSKRNRRKLKKKRRNEEKKKRKTQVLAGSILKTTDLKGARRQSLHIV